MIINRVTTDASMPAPEVGMGATATWVTDRHAGTIISVSGTGKTLKWQMDKATRTDGGGRTESQTYSYERHKFGIIITFRLTDRGWRCATGARLDIGVRDEYYDFSN